MAALMTMWYESNYINYKLNRFKIDCSFYIYISKHFQIQCLKTREKLLDTTERFIAIQDSLLKIGDIGCETPGEDCSRIMFLSQGGMF